MPIKKVLETGGVPVKIWTDEVELKSLNQLENVAGLPFVFHHVAAMPDVHAGMGATIGSVIATKRAVIPTAVGVDIGCGMAAVRLNLERKRLNERTLTKAFEAILRVRRLDLRSITKRTAMSKHAHLLSTKSRTSKRGIWAFSNP